METATLTQKEVDLAWAALKEERKHAEKLFSDARAHRERAELIRSPLSRGSTRAAATRIENRAARILIFVEGRERLLREKNLLPTSEKPHEHT